MARLVGLGACVAVILVACGQTSSTSDPDPSATTDTACTALTAPPACGAPIDVGSAAEVEAQIRKLGEVVFGLASAAGADLRPSPDLRVTTDIELDIAPFRGAGSACASPSGTKPRCVESWAFSGEKNVQWRPVAVPSALPLIDGVVCKDAACTRIGIKAGTILRFQRAYEPYRFAQKFSHYVRVVRPCAAPCANDELSCSTSTTCIAASAFCVLCEGKPATVCACRSGCNVEADGTSCAVQTSEDTGETGVCNAGTCQ